MDTNRRRFKPAKALPSPEHARLLADLGGPKAVVAIVERRVGYKISSQAISNWSRRGIPYRYRAPLALEAAAQGVSVPANFLGEEPPPPRAVMLYPGGPEEPPDYDVRPAPHEDVDGDDYRDE